MYIFRPVSLILFLLVFKQEPCGAQTEELYQKKDGHIFGLDKKLNIRRLSVTDTGFKNSITRFIENQTKKDSALERYGYLELTPISPSDRGYCFHLSVRYYYFYLDFADANFPLFYTMVNKKLVLIYLNNPAIINYRIKKKAKKRIIRLINKQLPKIESQTIETETGNIVLRPVGHAVTENISSVDICK